MSTSFHVSMLDDPDRVAVVVRASALFGLLTRSLDLPPFWTALSCARDGTRRVWPVSSRVDGDDLEEVLLVRTTPIALDAAAPRMASRDGFAVSGSVSLTLRPLSDRAELLALREHLMAGRREVRASDLVAYITPNAAAALTDWCTAHDASALLDSEAVEALTATLQSALSGPLFKAGLEWVDCRVRLESPTWDHHRQQRHLQERRRSDADALAALQAARATARHQHVTHLADLLSELERLATASPQADFPSLLRSFASTDRGALYDALWGAAVAHPTTAIVVAVGHELVYIIAAHLDGPQRRVALPDVAGPVRSLARCAMPDGADGLVVGCATGLHVVTAATGEVSATHVVPDVTRSVRGGFNAGASAGGCLVGSHSELGLWCWPDSGTARALLPDHTSAAQVVRHASFFGGRLWCSIDATVHCMAPADVVSGAAASTAYTGSGAIITALCPRDTAVLAGTADGRILQWELEDPVTPTELVRGAKRPVETVAICGTAGIERLCYTDTSTALHAVVVGDHFAWRFEAGGQTLRWAEVGTDCVVATNETRDRLFHWSVATPGAAPTVLPIGRWIGRSVQDVCLITTPLA